jgi:hypothetical protein
MVIAVGVIRGDNVHWFSIHCIDVASFRGCVGGDGDIFANFGWILIKPLAPYIGIVLPSWFWWLVRMVAWFP